MIHVTRKAVGLLLVSFCLGLLLGAVFAKVVDIPGIQKPRKIDSWSIAILTGRSPVEFSVPDGGIRPVLTAKDVRDAPADFVADPFMVRRGSTWYLFFELLNIERKKGEIGYATSSDGLQWHYEQRVLVEPFHLSYPYVFEWENTFYMIPESIGANQVRLYKAVDFPAKWEFVCPLIYGQHVDPTIVRFEDQWWMFTGGSSTPQGHDTLRLHHAPDLMGPWVEHPKSPLVQFNAHIARPGGRAIVWNGNVIRFTQDCDPTYGNRLRAFQVTTLSEHDYAERELPMAPELKASGTGWNAAGMHTIDPHQLAEDNWIACVDGYQNVNLGYRFGRR